MVTGVHKAIHAIKRQAILDTQALYNQVIAFYQEFFVAHQGVFEENVPYTKKTARYRNVTGPPRNCSPSRKRTRYRPMLIRPL